MKSIVPAVVLAVAILIGLYFHGEANRYQVVTRESGRPMRVDHRTGRLWTLGPNEDLGWYLVGEAAKDWDSTRSYLDTKGEQE